MALATRCPACDTVFRISTAQAAAKGGMVRCGQCLNVFNSLDALVRVEDLDVLHEESVEPGRPTDEAANDGDAAPAATRVPADEADAAPDVSPRPIAEAGVPVDELDMDVAPDLLSPGPAPETPERSVISEWWLPERQEPPPLANLTIEHDPLSPGPPRDEPASLLSGRRTDLQWSGAELEGTSPTFMRPDENATPSRRMARGVLALLSVFAAIALLAQLAYLWRDELAARWSPARPWLTAACVPLRCRVDYPTHLDSITIESASIATSGPNLGVYTLTALLRNRDAIDIRYPYLDLVLTDLQDRPILRRALRPEDYLPAGRAGTTASPAGFAAGSELPIRVMFELNDLRFAGYRLERFYP